MSESNFGWELLYKTAESSLNNKSDVLIAFVHFFLIKNKFKCVGIGDDKTIGDEDKNNKSELLPEGWNQMEGVYKLRYLCDDQLYILIGTPCDELVILNMIDVGTQKVTNCTLSLEDTVVFNATSASAAIKTMSDTLVKLNAELLEPTFKGTQKTIQTQTDNKKKREPDLTDIRSRIIDPVIPDFPEVGRGDLDPFGRGSGSIFPGPGSGPRINFPNPLAPLGVPPGARFDPFGPPTGNRFDPLGPRRTNRFEPDPDHFRPPGYDDMFM